MMYFFVWNVYIVDLKYLEYYKENEYYVMFKYIGCRFNMIKLYVLNLMFL